MILDARYEFAKKIPTMWKMKLPQLDLFELQKEFATFIEKTPFNDNNQINLTSPSVTEQNPYDGLGSIYSKEDNRNITKESQYKYFIKKFKNSFFHSLYQEVSNASPLPIGRVRMMKLKPKACYSFHRDNSVRFHLVIHTNPGAYLIFKENGLYHLPADGQIYATNTLLEHTAMNSGDSDRIHLVFSTAWAADAEERLLLYYGKS